MAQPFPAQAEGPAASQPAAKVNAAEDYKQLTDQLSQTANPADGVPLLEKFIADHAGNPMAEVAGRELALWKMRVEKGLVRFGPTGWLPKAEVDKKNEAADKLVTRASGEDKPEVALKTLTEAAAASPFRADIQFKKFEVLMKATPSREKDANGPLAVITGKIDPNNVAAINNLGVLAARQKQWQVAFDLLLKAAGKSPDTDVLWDNFDQAFAMAQASGVTMTALIAADSQMRGVVGKIHKAGKRVGDTRWGNSWIPEKDFETYKEGQSRSLAEECQGDRGPPAGGGQQGQPRCAPEEIECPAAGRQRLARSPANRGPEKECRYGGQGSGEAQETG